ncbi:hypothetical protein [Brevibacillus centrosporus]|uniref:Uncharacterized protein n=1 Tax=Brevibacillus centrosporus TaxID=54910 RepID=A0A1I3VNW2_9BACL|nr:hypothetical protein [Brevibacillus centrosporus]MEC2130772.1 hypothetical protein [Brevibacillus centrosporus]MED4908136.1 hypothetical protein [Brevibacillus centrosporus]RNB69197.1 hypothetical protein EDM55_14690 [Brevibacillus centrosporus]SFJ96862.1 hypothetical protein SAMN05518846_107107 [Brevibacillus centrosporus]GED32203.1 hypothetical protein BCE02nite_33440 [Brevibacillus centrosporus]
MVGNLLLFHQAGGILGALIGGIAFDVFHDYQFLIVLDAVLCGIAVVGYRKLMVHKYFQKGELHHISS